MNLGFSYASLLAVVVLLTDVSDGRRFRRQDEETTPEGEGGEATPKKCIKCTSYKDCEKREMIMDCTSSKMSDLSLDKEETAMWDLIKGAADMDASDKYEKCLTLQWDGKGEFRGCVPSKVDDKDVCDYIKDKGKDKKISLCEACVAAADPCNNGTALKNAAYPRGVTVDTTTAYLIASAFFFRLML